jgi:hypothetical protein
VDASTASLIVGLSSAGVAVGALALNVFSTRGSLDLQREALRSQEISLDRTFENQRRMASDERLWSQREKVYEELLAFATGADISVRLRVPIGLHLRVMLVASERVKDLVGELWVAGEGLNRPDADEASIGRLEADYDIARGQVLEALREDLNPH